MSVPWKCSAWNPKVLCGLALSFCSIRVSATTAVASRVRFFGYYFFVLVLFPALYSFTGIRLVPGRSGTPAGNYPGTTGSQIAPSDVSKPKKFGCSAIKEFAYTCASATWLSLEVATFQKNTTIEPATMAGRHIATIEAIVAPGQFALFFLAIRRRFKR